MRRHGRTHKVLVIILQRTSTTSIELERLLICTRIPGIAYCAYIYLRIHIPGTHTGTWYITRGTADEYGLRPATVCSRESPPLQREHGANGSMHAST